MDILNLCLVFAAIIGILTFKKPLFLAILGGLVTAVLLYQIPMLDVINLIAIGTLSKSTLDVILSFYCITFLQRMLEKRERLKQAQESLNGIFNNRRISASLAPAVIGLLPSAGALPICARMVNDTCDEYLDKEEKTFVTSFFRHIPESFLPTYGSIIIAIALSGVSTGSFVLAMLPMVIVLFILGYIFYLRKIPKETNTLDSTNKKAEVINFVKSLWTIALTIILILVLNMPVYIATGISIIINYFVDKFNFAEIAPMFTSALEKIVILSTILIMIFKEVISYTGVINELAVFFGQFSMPLSLVFALIFFFGTIVSGAKAIVALCMPMAINAIPNGGLPLVVLLMCFSYAAMQISPTHICLFIATDYFDTSMKDLIKRTLPVISCFCIIVIIYYELLKFIY